MRFWPGSLPRVAGVHPELLAELERAGRGAVCGKCRQAVRDVEQRVEGGKVFISGVCGCGARSIKVPIPGGPLNGLRDDQAG